jgi:hypothetical protein
MVFSAVRLHLWFLHYFKHVHLLHEFILAADLYASVSSDGLVSCLLLTAAMMLLLRRKPPDLFFEFRGHIIQVHRRRNALLLRFITFFLALFGLVAFFHSNPSSHTHCCDNRASPLSAFTAAASAEDSSTPRDMGGWHSDSYPIIVDSAASFTITNKLSDLIDPVPHDCALSGIGSARITHRGTIKWTVLTDAGQPAVIEDRNAYFSEQAPYRLLAPHGWQKTMHQKHLESGASEGGDQVTMMLLNNAQGYVLSWDRGRKQVTAALDETTNLPTIYSAPGYSDFNAFMCCFNTFPTIIPDDDDEDAAPAMEMATEESDDDRFTPSSLPRNESFGSQDELQSQKPKTSPDDPITYRDEDLFLSWHVKFGHAPFNQVRWLA